MIESEVKMVLVHRLELARKELSDVYVYMMANYDTAATTEVIDACIHINDAVKYIKESK